MTKVGKNESVDSDFLSRSVDSIVKSTESYYRVVDLSREIWVGLPTLAEPQLERSTELATVLDPIYPPSILIEGVEPRLIDSEV